MAKIVSLSSRHLSEENNLERIVAAARAQPGIWLMVREREMELRAMQAELRRLGADVSEIDRLFPERLTPLLSELASDLVSHMFGSCPAEMLAPVQEALLEAARHETDASR